MNTNVQKALLRKGYFPRELPPAFTTDSFGIHSNEILADWEKSGLFSKKKEKLSKKLFKRGSYSYILKHADAEVFSKPKRGYERRNLHITHPLPQALLAHEMSVNWKDILKWIARQTYSEDKIVVSDQYDRSIKGINFQLHSKKKQYIESTSDWLVTTDITRFYPSIYTHSITWAAYGKEKVKSNLNLYSGSIADRLDVLVRSCNRNQTVGIPIGPETSRIVAEIISSRIDCDFQDQQLDVSKDKIDRLQDDWTIGLDSLEQSERAISIISKIYNAYGLDINGSKTSIDRILSERKADWISELNEFLSHQNGYLIGRRLNEFMYLCLRLQSKNRSDSVINYGLSVIENTKIVISDVPNVETFLLKSAVVAPNAMDRICRTILNVQHNTGKISKRRVASRFIQLAEDALERGHIYETLWLLYTLRGLRVLVDFRKLCAIVEGVQSSCLALVLLDMKEKKLVVGTLPVDLWGNAISDESINSDWTWLLAYEAFRRGWLPDKQGLMRSKLFKPMATRNVVFYDDRRNIGSSKVFSTMRTRVYRRDRREVIALLNALRGVDLMDY